MAVYTVTNKMLLDNYAVLELLTPPDMVVGQSITVAGVDTTFNGTYTIVDLPQYQFIGVDTFGDLIFDGSVALPNQVLYAKTAANVVRVAAAGTVTYTQVCTWITGADIAAWIGLTTGDETAFLAQCASAANQFCWRRRQESGNLNDSLTSAPSGDVTLGTIMYGGALYRQRGSIDQFASFTEIGTAPVVGLSPIIKQLLGLGAHSVA